jgi:CBS-domain-containing membrane protein
MGFPRVYDYEGGKKDWGSWGLPHEGTNVPSVSAADVAHADVPTCTLDDELTEVRARVRAAGWDTCIVVNDRRVVLGRLGRKAVAADTDETVAEAMTPGPSTIRPSIGADALLERLRSRELHSILVTTPNGRLVGLVRRGDLLVSDASGNPAPARG